MTELIVFTGGRPDAYDDYRQSVVRGESYETLAGYLDDDLLATLRAVHPERVPLWCTQREHYWRRLAPGDQAVFYHDERLVGRATVLATAVSLPLAERLWRAPETTWSDADPWQYLVFFEDFRAVDVPLEAFNALLDYEPHYVPHGVGCVSAERIVTLERRYGSVSAALDALVAGEDDPRRVTRERPRHRREHVGNPEKAKDLQAMVREMFGSDTTPDGAEAP
jgi:hypothetical protein